MKWIANYISVSRIFLSFMLMLTKPLGLAFVVIYVLCGVSDMLDGYIARKTNTTSKLGERLDSVADLIMVVIVIILLYPLINLSTGIIMWMVLIAIVRIFSIMVVYMKYKTVLMLHTYGNKFTGLMLFIFPLIFAFNQSDMVLYIICLIATTSAFEELFIHLVSTDLKTDRKSIFEKM